MGFLRDIGAPGVIVLIIESIGKMFTSFKKSISGLTEEENSDKKDENKDN